MTIGSLSLSPAFAPEVVEYSTTTTNETNKITATPAKSGAAVEIKVNDAAVENGGSGTWNEGVNTVKITVRYGTTTQVYTVTVTKTAAG